MKPPALYVLGPDDQITLQGPNADELVNKPARPMRMEMYDSRDSSLYAGGLTIGEFERLLNQKLKVYIRNPQIVVSVSEFKSQPVSVIGAVNSPGVHQIQGQKTLVEMISLAGGLRSDAGSRITITRLSAYGPLPLLSAKEDQSGKFSTAEISIRDITAESQAARKYPGDVPRCGFGCAR